MERGGIAPHILDLRTRWRWVVSFWPADLPAGKEPWVNVAWAICMAPELVWTWWQRGTSLSRCPIRESEPYRLY